VLLRCTLLPNVHSKLTFKVDDIKREKNIFELPKLPLKVAWIKPIALYPKAVGPAMQSGFSFIEIR